MKKSLTEQVYFRFCGGEMSRAIESKIFRALTSSKYYHVETRIAPCTQLFVMARDAVAGTLRGMEIRAR